MSELPLGWCTSQLESLLVFVIGGDWGKAADFDDEDYAEVLCIRGSEFKKWKSDKGSTASLRKVRKSSLETRRLQLNDILVEISGGGPDQPVGRTVLIDDDAISKNGDIDKVCTNFLRLVRSSNSVNSKYLNYYLSKFYNTGEVTKYQGGSNNLRNLKFKEYITIPIPIAPLNEQIRIANKLGSLLAKVDAAQARLEKIPALLKRFRQSVLAAATSGELTREWRGESLTSWQILSVDDLAEVKGGKRLPKGEALIDEDTGLRYIRAGQLKRGTVISTDEARSRQLFLTPEIQSKISKYTVKTGDVYLTIVGASIGDAGVIPHDFDGANLTENAAKITEFKKPLISEFLSYWLCSHELQETIKLEIKSGAQGKLALKRIRELPAPYTDIREQKEIVRRVESLFAVADTVENQYLQIKQRTDRLTQSLLAKAFRGELVPQDPNDEPAADLLKRIQAERESQSKKKQAKKSQKKAEVKNKVTKVKKMTLDDAADNYLSTLLSNLGGEAPAEELWKKSELNIDDFYAKLKQEINSHLIVDDSSSADPSLRKLKSA